MSAISDALDELKTVVEGVAGIQTVYTTPPQVEPTGALLPAVIFEIKPATAPLIRLTTRAIVWPVDLWVLVEPRGTDIEASLPEVWPFPELIIAAIDANGNLGGLLDRSIAFGEPAFSMDDRAFGPATMGDTDYVGTVIHTLLTITRVGGFAA
jgi:hypothetical protein